MRARQIFKHPHNRFLDTSQIRDIVGNEHLPVKSIEVSHRARVDVDPTESRTHRRIKKYHPYHANKLKNWD